MKRLPQYDVFDLPIADIYYDGSFNCRGEFTIQSCGPLAESIATNGLNFPVVVQPIEDMPEPRPNFKFRLIAGHRRYTAAVRHLKWISIPASLRIGLTEPEARMLNFTENLERKDLNILEEARWIGNYFPEGVSLRTAATLLKRDSRWVHIRLRLLKLPEEIQQMAASETLSKVDIETIAALDTPELQLRAAHDIQAAKRRGESREVGTKYGRKFRYRKSKAQISEKVAYMLERGLGGIGPRALTWAAGYISDDELNGDIENELTELRAKTQKTVT